jgi:hypothetical protein
VNELDQARARLLAQQIQITRLHVALSRIAASGELSDPQVAMAREALEACEADAGQIAADVSTVLREVPPIRMLTPQWEAYARLRDAFGID